MAHKELSASYFCLPWLSFTREFIFFTASIQIKFIFSDVIEIDLNFVLLFKRPIKTSVAFVASENTLEAFFILEEHFHEQFTLYLREGRERDWPG